MTYHQAATVVIDVTLPSGYSGPTLAFVLTSSGNPLWMDSSFESQFETGVSVPITGAGLQQIVYVDPSQAGSTLTASVFLEETAPPVGEEEKSVTGTNFNLTFLPAWGGGPETKDALEQKVDELTEGLKQDIFDAASLLGDSEDELEQFIQIMNFRTQVDGFRNTAIETLNTSMSGKIQASVDAFFPAGSNGLQVAEMVKARFADGTFTVAPDVVFQDPLPQLRALYPMIMSGNTTEAEALLKDPGTYFKDVGVKFSYLSDGVPTMDVRISVEGLSRNMDWNAKKYTLDITVYRPWLPEWISDNFRLVVSVVPSTGETIIMPTIGIGRRRIN